MYYRLPCKHKATFSLICSLRFYMKFQPYFMLCNGTNWINANHYDTKCQSVDRNFYFNYDYDSLGQSSRITSASENLEQQDLFGVHVVFKESSSKVIELLNGAFTKSVAVHPVAAIGRYSEKKMW